MSPRSPQSPLHPGKIISLLIFGNIFAFCGTLDETPPLRTTPYLKNIGSGARYHSNGRSPKRKPAWRYWDIFSSASRSARFTPTSAYDTPFSTVSGGNPSPYIYESAECSLIHPANILSPAVSIGRHADLFASNSIMESRWRYHVMAARDPSKRSRKTAAQVNRGPREIKFTGIYQNELVPQYVLSKGRALPPTHRHKRHLGKESARQVEAGSVRSGPHQGRNGAMAGQLEMYRWNTSERDAVRRTANSINMGAVIRKPHHARRFT